MINVIKSQGKVWLRRSKNLVSGTIECHRCGDEKKVVKFTGKHFTVEFICRTCNKELNVDKVKPKRVSKPKKPKPTMAKDCPHKYFFGCKGANGCIGCYYNPDVKMALKKATPDDPKKNKTDNWFYGNKAHAKKALKLLDDIRLGRGLKRGGKRFYFKHSKNKDEE
jgi:hypothetical protein